MNRKASEQEVQQTLEQMAHGQTPERELAINPWTWELEVVQPGRRGSPDVMPLLPIARDFYAGTAR